MTDNVSQAERSRVMSQVKSRGNRSTERRVEDALLESGIGGWQKHASLLGNPDFYFPAHRLAVFVDGCFWHACPAHVRIPRSNADYWTKKIDRNRRRDNRLRRKLRSQRVHVMRIWEHDLSNDRWLCRLQTMLRRLSAETDA